MNVLGTINVLEAARQSRRAGRIRLHRWRDLRRGGGAASCPSPRRRRACPRPRTGRASSPARSTSASTGACTGSPGVALRFGNVYGPRQDPHGEAGVVAIFCGLLRGGRPAAGLRRRRADPRLRLRRRRRRRDPRRRAAPRPPRAPRLPVPTTSAPASRPSVLDLAAPARGRRPAPTPRSSTTRRAPGEVERVAIDPSAARRDLGWTAATELDDGLAANRERRSTTTPERATALRRSEVDPLQVGEHRVALGGAVERVTGGQHEPLVADVVDDPGLVGVDDPGVGDLVGERRRTASRGRSGRRSSILSIWLNGAP